MNGIFGMKRVCWTVVVHLLAKGLLQVERDVLSRPLWCSNFFCCPFWEAQKRSMPHRPFRLTPDRSRSRSRMGSVCSDPPSGEGCYLIVV